MGVKNTFDHLIFVILAEKVCDLSLHTEKKNIVTINTAPDIWLSFGHVALFMLRSHLNEVNFLSLPLPSLPGLIEPSWS